MSRKVKSSLSLILFSLLLSITNSGCNLQSSKKNAGESGKYLYSEEIRYAKGFEVEYYEEYTKVVVNNPWSNSSKPYEVYYLYDSGSKKGKATSDGTILNIPLTSLAVNTFSYFEFLSLLGELDIVSGVSDGFRIYNPDILKKIESGEIIDLGDPFNPSIEKTMAIRPQAIINTAYAQIDNYSERLKYSGFKVIYTLEWMENSPLARAEWIKMIALFFDKKELADSIFYEIENRYLTLKEKVNASENIKDRKMVMSGDNFQGTWYVPGGKSFNATLFNDAGMEYYYKNNDQSGSIGLDIETVLTQFRNADLWIGSNANLYEELVTNDTKFLLLKPVKEKQVFNNHNRTTKTGGNDYFESAIANPDLILSDLVKAAYPDLLPNYSFTYIKPLY